NDRRKNEFLAMLAHELRNPLAPVWSAVELMRLKETGDPDLNWARDMIGRQVRHLVRLVDDLLDVSRITRGKIKLSPEVVDVAAVVAGAVETSPPLVDAQGPPLTVTVPDGPLYVLADSARLTQVLTNLLNNAAKYTPEGGQIWLTVEHAANGFGSGEVLFSVKDSGAGIPGEMLGKVFDLFTQVDRSIDRSQGGLGIGLTLVRGLVELQGGRVEAHSAGPGQGSEFVVRLPLFTEPVRQGESSGAGPADHCASPCRVLVVDDNISAADGL